MLKDSNKETKICGANQRTGLYIKFLIYVVSSTENLVYELTHELPNNDLRLKIRKLEILEKSQISVET